MIKDAKKDWKKSILFLFWLAWMLLIFWFSSKSADVSTEESLTVGKLICSIIVNGYDSMTEVSQLQYAEMLDHFVRKSAHFLEYGVLGALNFGMCSVYLPVLKRFQKSAAVSKVIMKKGSVVYLAWIWGAIYAVTDEIHQLFVPGRYGTVLDVILDAAGVLTGILACVFVALLHKKYKGSRKAMTA